MNSEKTKELFAKYPTFFKPEKGPMETLMCFGLECDEGWYDILDRLFKAITDLKPEKTFEVIQVKEKFGGLRVYCDYSTDEIEDLIMKAEEESYRTCEICGKPGKMCSDGGWMKTLCPDCAKENNYTLKVEELP